MSTLPKNVDVDVAIIGGGPGGLALGVALSQRGISATIFEANTGIPAARRGEFLQPNGLRVLDDLGVLPPLREQDVWVNRTLGTYAPGGRLLSDLDYSVLDVSHNYILIHKPYVLRQSLFAALGSTEIVWGARCERLERHNNTWHLTVKVNEEVITVRAGVVVGADGARSWVRKTLGIGHTLRPYRDAYALNVVPKPPGFTGDGRQYQGKGMLLGVLPVSETELYMYWHVAANRIDQFQASGVGAFRERLIAVAPDIAPDLEIPPLDEWLYLRPHKVTCQTWVADGAALIGDAAHAMSPNTGQGTNQTLEDAVVLADVLAEGFRGGRLGADHLKAYEQARRPAVQFMQKLGDERTRLWTSSNPFISSTQERATANMARHPQIARKVVAQAAGLSTEPMSITERLRLLV